MPNPVLYFSDRVLAARSGTELPEGAQSESVVLLRVFVATLKEMVAESDPLLAARLTAGEVEAARLIERSLRHLIRRLVRGGKEDLLEKVLGRLDQLLGTEVVDQALETIHQRAAQQFSISDPAPWLLAPEELESTEESKQLEVADGRARRTDLFEEFLVFTVLDENPPLQPLLQLLHDPGAETADSGGVLEDLRSAALDALEDVASTVEGLDAGLLEPLRAPWKLAEETVGDQLPYVADRWPEIAPAAKSVDGREEPSADQPSAERERLLRGLALVREERTPRFPPGPGPVERPSLMGTLDPAEYTPDFGWMERLVVIAKSTFVWLEQLTSRYGRPVTRLDQVPNEELDELAHRGFSALWLIGLWRRSEASAEIKRQLGNPEAEASAYSLDEYEIAAELGGWDALEDLQLRARRRGIRLGADMVPNHMAIDSRWVVEHPDWFLASTDCPFPNYTFGGQDLSNNAEVGIYLEDHYWDRSDAAVVFLRVDRKTGERRYVYHGNDGTSVPWNDTAQLDYLNPELREQIIQTILRLARTFPVLRFDAAMTLATRHIHRLWYPDVDAAGAIPSRSEYGVSTEEFERLMPREFWREVVDRVKREQPGTLLLAEAFWLMEGYFVRTLGMHRVYNSAFMNMLAMGLNQELRKLIQEILTVDPEMLKRFLNFLSNPDEKPARLQFGDSDRYFGAATFLATFPGLPLFGHGQVEGWREKYGMEYRRAYVDEAPSGHLEQRHLQEVAPLLRRRDLFGGVDGFELFDCTAADGTPIESVYAYISGSPTERVLCLFNNSAKVVDGTISVSAPRLRADDEQATSLSLGQVLGWADSRDRLLVARERLTQKELVLDVGSNDSAAAGASSSFPVQLRPYQFALFDGFRWIERQEVSERWLQRNAGRLRRSIRWAVYWDRVRERRIAWNRLLDDVSEGDKLLSLAGKLEAPRKLEAPGKSQAVPKGRPGGQRSKAQKLGSEDAPASWQEKLRDTVAVLDGGKDLFEDVFPGTLSNSDRKGPSVEELWSNLDRSSKPRWSALGGADAATWRRAALHALAVRRLSGEALEARVELDQALSLGSWQGLAEGAEMESAKRRAVEALGLLFVAREEPLVELREGIDQPAVREFLAVHEGDDDVWFHAEAWSDLCYAWALSLDLFEFTAGRTLRPRKRSRDTRIRARLQQLLELSAQVNYRWSGLLEALWGAPLSDSRPSGEPSSGEQPSGEGPTGAGSLGARSLGARSLGERLETEPTQELGDAKDSSATMPEEVAALEVKNKSD